MFILDIKQAFRVQNGGHKYHYTYFVEYFNVHAGNSSWKVTKKNNTVITTTTISVLLTNHSSTVKITLTQVPNLNLRILNLYLPNYKTMQKDLARASIT